MERKKKNTNALEGRVGKKLNDKKLKPEDQQEHERGCTSCKTNEPCELFGPEATLRAAKIQEYLPNKPSSAKNEKVVRKILDCSVIGNDDPKESPSFDVASRENNKLVESVADSVTPTQDEPEALSSGGESFSFISDRLQDLDLEEHSVAPDGGTVDALKKVGTTGKLSDQGEAKIFAAVNDVGTKVMQAVFQTIFFAREIKGQEEDTTVTLDKWFEKYKFNKDGVKDKVGGQYWKNCTDPLTTKYDFQFYMFAIDLYYNNKKCTRLVKDSMGDLKKVKYFRDKLCHRGLLNTPAIATLKTLAKVYVDILENVGTRCDNKTYTQPVLESVPKLIAHIIKNDQDLGQFGEVKDQFFSELRPKFINAAQKELAKNVNRNFTNPFYWIHEDMSMGFKFALNDVYCTPWLVGGDERLEVSKLLLFPERGVPPQVLILGGDGATGKTTLCHMMFSQWQEKHEKEPTFLRLKHFDLVLLLELRNINDISLVEYLKQNLLADTIEKTIHPNDLLEILQDLDVLYIIDGFDEKDIGGRNVKLVKDIANNLSKKSRVLLTTRSEYRREAENLFSTVNNDCLDLRGLDHKGQIELSLKLINVLRKGEYCKELHEQFRHFLKERGNVFMDRLRIPLIMDLLVLLWLESKDDDSILLEIKSATQLYQHLVKMLKGKLAERLARAAGRGTLSGDTSEHSEQSESDSSDGEKAFPTHPAYLDECAFLNSLDQMIIILSEVAYRHTRAGIVNLKLDQNDLCRLKESCANKRIDDMQFFSAFLIHDERAKVPQFSFFHRTETDYFSAVFITEEAKVKKCFDLFRYFPRSMGMMKYKETILFLVGCFSIDNVLNRYPSQIMEMVELAQVGRYDFNFYFRLLVESGSGKSHTLDSDGCKEPLCLRVADYLPLQLWNLKDDTAIAGLRILMHCFHVKISELEIDFAQQVDPDSDENLVSFSDVMERLKWALKRRFCKEKRNEIVLSLHIRHHALGDGTSTSDRYLSYLHPWAKLTKFTGHIGVEASQHLFYCTNLKDLDIRITSVTAYNRFMENCLTRYSRLRKMTMRLCFSPGTVDVPSLLPFPNQGPKSVRTAVRLHFRKVQKVSFDEIINIILQITGRQGGVLERVVINSSDLDLVSAETIFKQLQSIVCEKVSVSSNTELRDDKLTNFRGVPSSFIFEWNDRNISEKLWAGPKPSVVYRGPVNRR